MVDLKLMIEKAKSDSQKRKLFFKFENSLKKYDMETIEKCLNEGIDIKEYEKYNGPAIIDLIFGFSDATMEFAKSFYDNKYIDYYFNDIYYKDMEELDPNWQDFYKKSQAELLKTMNNLLEKGASVNAVDVETEDLSSIFAFYTGKRKVEKSMAPLEIIVNFTDYLKTDKIVNLILSQNGIEKDLPHLIYRTLDYDNNVGTAVLTRLLEAGVPIEKSPSSVGFTVSPLELCFSRSKKTATDKINVLLKYANKGIVEDFKEWYESMKENLNDLLPEDELEDLNNTIKF